MPLNCQRLGWKNQLRTYRKLGLRWSHTTSELHTIQCIVYYWTKSI